MDGAVFLEWIGRYGLAAVFVIVALEYACFPVPSEIVLPFAGAFAAAMEVCFAEIFALSVAAGLLGCVVCYVLGYFGGGAVVGRITRRVPRTRKGLDASQKWFLKYGNLSVMAGRVLPLFRTWISFFAGIYRQNPLVFLGFSAVGISVWNFVLIGLGYKFGQNWTSVSLNAQRYKFVLFPGVALILLIAACNFAKKLKKES